MRGVTHILYKVFIFSSYITPFDSTQAMAGSKPIYTKTPTTDVSQLQCHAVRPIIVSLTLQSVQVTLLKHVACTYGNEMFL
jgi:hypothetical protein